MYHQFFSCLPFHGSLLISRLDVGSFLFFISLFSLIDPVISKPGSGSHFIGAHKEFTGFFVISAVVVC